MELSSIATAVLVMLGGFFIFAGTVGMLRFPDTLSRLHALTKADNLGLGLIVVGLALQADSAVAAAKLFLIWILALVASATAAFLIASRAQPSGDDAPTQPGHAAALGEGNDGA